MNPLEILGVSPGDPAELVKKQYRSLSLSYHPDKNKDPSAIGKFQEVQEAYKSICNNPSLLNPKKLEQSSGVGFIQIVLRVSVEDIYLKKEHTIVVDRLIVCLKCEGTGSRSGKKGLCSHCSGAGTLSGNVFKMLGTSNLCPVCGGSGRSDYDNCSVCLGNKYIIEKVYYNVVVDLKDYNKGFLVLKGCGNEHRPGKFGDIHVTLKVYHDTVLSIKDNEFICNVSITPAQKLIGDKKEISIYGKKVTYEVLPGGLEYLCYDKRSVKCERVIKFIYTEKPPRVIEETKALYEKIKKIEDVLGLINEF
jgi:molecular chaperone DnaJ